MRIRKVLEGLTPEEVMQSRARHGENRLTPPKKESLWKAFLEKFKDPLIIVLLVVMIFSTCVSLFEYIKLDAAPSIFLEPLGVLIALLLATTVGFVFEVKAARAFDVLNQVNDDTPVKVLRKINGHSQITQVPRCEVVVGDVVKIEAGEEVPADGLLLESVSLSVNESTLTGEPLAHKYVIDTDKESETAAVGASHTTATDEHATTYAPNALMKGTTVAEGHGTILVEKVGDATEYGAVYQATQIDDGVKTPLNVQLEQLGSIISKVSFIVAAFILVGRLVYFFFFDGDSRNDDDLLAIAQYVLSSIMIAVTLIVVSVPEGLPLSITMSLALSMKKMLKENNLVRKLHACETMGAATIICTDKTGTLTQNRMAVSDLQNFMQRPSSSLTDKALDIMAEAISVNTTAWIENDGKTPKVLGNPTEGALLLWLAAQKIDYFPLREKANILEQKPFTTETKQMSTVVDSALFGKKMLYVKGAPEMLLRQCKQIAGGVSAEEIQQLLANYQQKAMRTLGFAYASADEPDDLTFMAVTAIADPIRAEVPEAIKTCLSAGIRVVIVTGDTPGTAAEIGRQVGLITPNEQVSASLAHSIVLTGPEFEAMSDDEVLQTLPTLKILSRAKPMDKQRLVKLLQRQHHVVAVTGDGTNDAPALNAAQIGLSMGDGTSVAKEASDITIIDNSFSSISKAVMWGRSLYNNIGRFILFQMTVNVAACFIVLVGAFLGKESPLSVTQMLWVNLIMDTFAAMALSALPPDKKVMSDKPRSPKARIIDRNMLMSILPTGIGQSLALLLCWEYLPHYYFFTVFVMLQFWNLFNARYYRTDRCLVSDWRLMLNDKPAFAKNWSWGFMGIAGLILLGQLIIVNLGGEMFNITQRLSVVEWLEIAGYTSIVLVIGEIIRWMRGALKN